MPNWCDNQVEVSHPRTKKMRRLIGYIETESLCYSFAPYPYGEYSREWCCDNWNTKWDISDTDICDRDTNFIEFSFLTAWSPPISIYSKMKEQGYDVVATYIEGGMGYCGEYKEGQYYDYEFCDKNIPDKFKELIKEEKNK